MTIKVIDGYIPTFTLTNKDIKDGHAYMDESGFLYIGNRFDDIVGVSVCGNVILCKNDSTILREVNIEIRIVE